MERKAQGAIEYLLIIGAAILVVAVVVIALTGITSAGQDQVDTNAIGDATESLQCTKDINYLGECSSLDPPAGCACCTKYSAQITACP